jgi:hypothetical protein
MVEQKTTTAGVKNLSAALRFISQSSERNRMVL